MQSPGTPAKAPHAGAPDELFDPCSQLTTTQRDQAGCALYAEEVPATAPAQPERPQPERVQPQPPLPERPLSERVMPAAALPEAPAAPTREQLIFGLPAHPTAEARAPPTAAVFGALLKPLTPAGRPEAAAAAPAPAGLWEAARFARLAAAPAEALLARAQPAEAAGMEAYPAPHGEAAPVAAPASRTPPLLPAAIAALTPNPIRVAAPAAGQPALFGQEEIASAPSAAAEVAEIGALEPVEAPPPDQVPPAEMPPGTGGARVRGAHAAPAPGMPWP